VWYSACILLSSFKALLSLAMLEKV